MLSDLGDIIKPTSCTALLKYINLSIYLYINEEIRNLYIDNIFI